MINYLKDIKKETLIGQLPDVINSNNESIKKEFNWIFDSSLNRLTKSVYAPTGSIKAHFGEFTNLACEYFTVKNVDSLKYSIQDSVESIINETLNVSSMQTVMAALTNIANSSFIDPATYDISALCDISTLIVNHNVLNNRFKDIDFIDDDKQDFCHDAAAIVYKKDENNNYITVKQFLDQVETYDISINIDELSEEIQKCNTSINIISRQIQNLDSNINEINSNNLLTENVEVESLNILENRNNCVLKHITNNGTNIKIKLKDLNREYNFKVIVEPGVEYISLLISDNNGEVYWYNRDPNKFNLYNKLDDGFGPLEIDGNNTIILQLKRTENPEIIDITINRYVNYDEKIVCMLTGKILTLKMVK